MRRLPSYLLVLSVILFVSCVKQEREEYRTVSVRFSETRSSVADDCPNDNINTVDVLVFRDSGGYLDNHTRNIGEITEVKVTANQRLSYYVIANAPQGAFDQVGTKEDLALQVCLLEDIVGSHVMVGTGVDYFANDTVITVNLDRLASKVTLTGITPSFLGNSYKDAVVKLERVFLINVNGSCPYNAVPRNDGYWFNRMKMESLNESMEPLLVQEIGRTLTSSSTVDCDIELYCMPNVVSNGVYSDTQPVWSPRNTRIVIELSIDGVANYYPITLPSMSCNRNYKVYNVILLGPGANNPDCLVNRSTTVDYLISVNQWIKDNKNINF